MIIFAALQPARRVVKRVLIGRTGLHIGMHCPIHRQGIRMPSSETAASRGIQNPGTDSGGSPSAGSSPNNDNLPTDDFTKNFLSPNYSGPAIPGVDRQPLRKRELASAQLRSVIPDLRPAHSGSQSTNPSQLGTANAGVPRAPEPSKLQSADSKLPPLKEPGRVENFIEPQRRQFAEEGNKVTNPQPPRVPVHRPPPASSVSPRSRGTSKRLDAGQDDRKLEDASDQSPWGLVITRKLTPSMEEAAEAIRDTWHWDDQKFAQQARDFYLRRFHEAYAAQADKGARVANAIMAAEMSPLVVAYGLLASGWAVGEIVLFLQEAGLGTVATLRTLFQTLSPLKAAITASQYPALQTLAVAGAEAVAGDTGVSLEWPTSALSKMEGEGAEELKKLVGSGAKVAQSKAAGKISGEVQQEIGPAERGLTSAARKTRTTVAQLYDRDGEQSMAELVARSRTGDRSVAEEAIELGTSKSGSTLWQYRGRYYSVPKGRPLQLPKDDRLGDELIYETQKIADGFNPLKLSEAQKRALKNSPPAARGGLMVAYKGSWVHKEVEKRFAELKWSSRGIDALGPDMSYEVLTWSEYGVVSHLGRIGGMDKDIWRAIYYTEEIGIGKYLQKLGL
jgi:hypothetical protein